MAINGLRIGKSFTRQCSVWRRVPLPERGREVVGYRQKGSTEKREGKTWRNGFFAGEKSRWVKFNQAVGRAGDEGKRNRDHAANFYGRTLFGSQAAYNFRNPVRELPPPKSERVRDFNMYPLSRLKLAPEFLKTSVSPASSNEGWKKNFPRGAHLRPPSFDRSVNFSSSSLYKDIFRINFEYRRIRVPFLSLLLFQKFGLIKFHGTNRLFTGTRCPINSIQSILSTISWKSV